MWSSFRMRNQNIQRVENSPFFIVKAHNFTILQFHNFTIHQFERLNLSQWNKTIILWGFKMTLQWIKSCVTPWHHCVTRLMNLNERKPSLTSWSQVSAWYPNYEFANFDVRLRIWTDQRKTRFWEPVTEEQQQRMTWRNQWQWGHWKQKQQLTTEEEQQWGPEQTNDDRVIGNSSRNHQPKRRQQQPE